MESLPNQVMILTGKCLGLEVFISLDIISRSSAKVSTEPEAPFFFGIG